MATMNKPAYAAIQTHSPTKPVSCACWMDCPCLAPDACLWRSQRGLVHLSPLHHAAYALLPLLQVLVFVSSRRQTRLTALDIIAYAAADEHPRGFVRMGEGELEQALGMVKVGWGEAALWGAGMLC